VNTDNGMVKFSLKFIKANERWTIRNNKTRHCEPYFLYGEAIRKASKSIKIKIINNVVNNAAEDRARQDRCC
jgi:hypothetical protein